ncbi:uncharacterized protein PG986_005115 [Apiospora aurea]|uniref:SET domain-containing protein n=1 Tax=Apiospora aurea TaxID=335848 RepID=A0ABR1QGM7_9PEZI
MIVSPAQFQRLRDRDKPSADVSHRYNIVETDKGMSIIATMDIPRSTVIIEEKPLIHLKDRHTKPRTRKDGIVLSGLHWQLAVNHLYNAMSLEDKALYDQLYYTENCMAPSEWDEVQLSPHGRADPDALPDQRARSEKKTIMVAAVRDIRKGEEITIPYTDPIAMAADRRLNLAPYGF